VADERAETVLEIIELDEGGMAIRTADTDDEPMIKVQFSDELKGKLDGQYLEVARLMLTAGIQLVAESGLDLSSPDDAEETVEPTIH
jgi:hypothetical protein